MQTSPVTEYNERQILEKTQHAAHVAHQLLDEIEAILKPGIKESEARTQAKQIFLKHGVEKSWHNPYIYFGTHTLMTFMDKTQEDFVLQADDIAYIDIGPIVADVEGDAGRTVIFGNNPLLEMLKFQSERLFRIGREYWLENNPTGVELYEYIHKLTEAAGFQFNLNPAGHLIGSFPHKGWKDGLQSYPFPVEAGLWILEIQIRHPIEPYGAFYETVLI